MAVTKIEESDASLTYTGAGWSTVVDASASGSGVASVTVNTGGAYSVAPTGATLTGGAGAGGALGAITTSGVSPNIAVTAVAVASRGQYALAPVITFTGGTGTAATATAVLGGGSYKSCVATGNSVSIAVPAGKNVVSLIARYIGGAATDSNRATVTVDGVAYPVWNQTAQTTLVTANTSWYQTTYPPIIVDPLTTHTIVVAWQAGQINIDAVKYYATAAPVLGRLTTFGHSIPAGAGLGSPTTQRFGALVATLLGMTEDNRTIGGESIATYPGANTVVAQAAYQRIAAGTDWELETPEIAMIMHGFNDVRHDGNVDPGGGFGYSLERYKQRMREAIWAMQSHCPAAQIVVVGITPMSVGWATVGGAEFEHGSAALGQQWEDALGGVCLESTMNGPLFVPIMQRFTAIGVDANLQSDFVHPTAQGHQIIADSIYRRILQSRQHNAVKVGL